MIEKISYICLAILALALLIYFCYTVVSIVSSIDIKLINIVN